MFFFPLTIRFFYFALIQRFLFPILWFSHHRLSVLIVAHRLSHYRLTVLLITHCLLIDWDRLNYRPLYSLITSLEVLPLRLPNYLPFLINVRRSIYDLCCYLSSILHCTLSFPSGLCSLASANPNYYDYKKET